MRCSLFPEGFRAWRASWRNGPTHDTHEQHPQLSYGGSSYTFALGYSALRAIGNASPPTSSAELTLFPSSLFPSSLFPSLPFPYQCHLDTEIIS
eukprot:gene765-4054_t